MFVKGYKQTKGHKRGISKALKGRKFSKEHRENIRQVKTGTKLSEKTKLKMSLAKKGKKNSIEHKENIRKARIGTKWSEETKKKISEHHARPNLGKHLSKETRRKLSKAHKGKKMSLKARENISKSLLGSKRRLGCRHSEETKIKMSESCKRNWQNPIYRENQIRATLKSLLRRPTSLEQKFIKLVKRYNLPYKYTGDGSFLIGFKCPDFININHEKICIEVREKKICRIFDKCSPEKYKRNRIKHFKKYGWKCIVLWEEDFIRERINLIKLGL